MKKFIIMMLTAALFGTAFCAYAEEEEMDMSVEVVSSETVSDPEEAMEQQTDDLVEDNYEESEAEASDTDGSDAEESMEESAMPESSEPAAEAEPQPTISETPDAATEEPNESIDPMSVTGSDLWTEQNPMPGGRADSMYFSIDGDMYVVGGIGENGVETAIYRYSRTSGEWRVETNIPGDIQGFTASALGDCIYIIGGVRGYEYLDEVHIYNTVDGTWSEGAPMSVKRSQAVSLTVDNKIYVFGGRDLYGFVDTYCEAYIPEENRWIGINTIAPELNRVGAQARYINGFICVYGGITADYEYGGVAFCDVNDLSTVYESAFYGYEDISVALTESKVLIFASPEGADHYEVKEADVYDGEVTINDIVHEMPVEHTYFTDYTIYNGELYCIGGYDGSSYLNSVYKYNEYYGDYNDQNGYIPGEITEAGNVLTIDAEAGKEYVLSVSVKNAQSIDGYTYTLEYLPEAFEVRDAYAATADWDRDIGEIKGSFITVTENGDGKLSFTTSETVPAGSKMTGPVNAVILKANSSGKYNIRYTMTKNQ